MQSKATTTTTITITLISTHLAVVAQLQVQVQSYAEFKTAPRNAQSCRNRISTSYADWPSNTFIAPVNVVIVTIIIIAIIIITQNGNIYCSFLHYK